jgi:AIG2-like family.
MKSKTLYIAYGSNLNLQQMAFRCPTAKVIGASKIKDYELLFRGGRRGSVATVEPLKGSHVPVLLWELKEKDLQALDRYEGYPHFYRKEILDVELNGKTISAMVYIMNDGHPFGAPSVGKSPMRNRLTPRRFTTALITAAVSPPMEKNLMLG